MKIPEGFDEGERQDEAGEAEAVVEEAGEEGGEGTREGGIVVECDVGDSLVARPRYGLQSRVRSEAPSSFCCCCCYCERRWCRRESSQLHGIGPKKKSA